MARLPRLLLVVILLSSFSFLKAGKLSAQASSDSLLVLNRVAVVDIRTGKIAPDQIVVIENKHIVSVSSGKSEKFPRGTRVVNCNGLFLIPGLWDMHVHLAFGDWFPRAKDISLPLFIANGVTGVRDMGSELDVVQRWRDEIETGMTIGPRIYKIGRASCRERVYGR